MTGRYKNYSVWIEEPIGLVWQSVIEAKSLRQAYAIAGRMFPGLVIKVCLAILDVIQPDERGYYQRVEKVPLNCKKGRRLAKKLRLLKNGCYTGKDLWVGFGLPK